jgi:hypothetical protein
MNKKSQLPMLTEKFLNEHGFEEYDVYTDIQMKLYKNKTHLLAVDFNNTFGSIHLVKNQEKFNQVLDTVKENFSCYKKRNNGECRPNETDQEKKERQEKELEERHQIFLQKNRL